MAGFYDVVDEVLMVERFLEVTNYSHEVGVEDFGNVIQVTADAPG